MWIALANDDFAVMARPRVAGPVDGRGVAVADAADLVVRDTVDSPEETP